MSKPVLSYFNFPGGRGEDCRIALHIAGIDFEDDRVKGPDWAGRKPSTPFGAMPVLTIGDVQLGQSNAILGLIGRKHGLMPTDLLEAARHDAIMNHCEDCRHKIGPTLIMKDPAEKQAAREAIAANYLPGWAGQLEAQLGDGPFIGGDDLGVADLKVWVLMRWFMGGVLDHLTGEVFDDTPALRAHFDRVGAHAGVQSWYQKD